MEAEKATFTGKVQALGRVVIPQVVRDSLEISQGDPVEVTVRKLGKVKV